MFRVSRWRGLFLAVVLGVGLMGLLGGCSDDGPPASEDTVQGKTPVVQPEDAQGRGKGGAAVLAPDYRRDLVPEAVDDGSPGRAPAATEPGADRLFAAKAGAARAQAKPAPGPAVPFPVPGCRQLVVVVAPDFAARSGVLRRLARDGADGAWRQTGEDVACVLGRAGLGLGRGLDLPLSGPAKREGDGRTPAGLFPLPEAFGYATAEAAQPLGVRLPYQPVVDRTACVTDPASPLFGRIVGPDQRSACPVGRQDRMRRDDGANRWGVVIGHNRIDPEAKAGSCVFINVRPTGGPPTGGSIGIPEAEAAVLATWLDPAAEPLLLVAPQARYQELRAAWKLP
jgi:L,D-peptidoglycan transpeptidase YkuD (ErfK/YbiS/YcfS/YnhG family)